MLLNTKDYEGLSIEEKGKLREWLLSNLKKTKTVNRGISSYLLKRLFDDDGGFYTTNDSFKAAMLDAGFSVADESELNWRFRIGSIRKLEARVYRRM
jgi:hypothetical protein